MNELELSAEDIREEHLADAAQTAHWVYLGAVILGGTALMLLLIAFLGGTSA